MKLRVKTLIGISSLIMPGTLFATALPDTPDKSSHFSLTPVTHIYSPYLADQKRVTNAVQLLFVADSDIPDSGNERFGLRLGGRLELFQYEWKVKDSGRRKQLQANLEVGFRGHFDNTRSQDNIGWDGNYGVLFSYRGSDAAAWRFGLYHTSSHVGDEYAERTGRLRIEYTREEYLVGVLGNITPRWQVYAEGGYAYNLKTKPLQEHKRVQSGVQYQQKRFSGSENYGWYMALDLSAYEERDWMVSRSLVLGLTRTAHTQTWRLALEFYDGQSPLGEFFQHNERYGGISLQIDV